MAIGEIWLIRHGFSRTNMSTGRPLPLPGKVVKVLSQNIGIKATTVILGALDAFRGKRTPYEVTDKQNPLTGKGHKQAFITGRIFGEKGIFPDMFLCSTYLRTTQTAADIMSGLKRVSRGYSAPILYSDLIVEKNAGERYGFPKTYFKYLFPKDSEQRTKDMLRYRPKEGESVYDVRHKRLPPLLPLLRKLKARTLFIVGHGYTNTCIRSLLTGESLDDILLDGPNLGVYHFIYQRTARKWKLDPRYDGSQPISGMVPYTRP